MYCRRAVLKLRLNGTVKQEQKIVGEDGGDGGGDDDEEEEEGRRGGGAGAGGRAMVMLPAVAKNAKISKCKV